MSTSMLGVRIPEVMHKYIKHKAVERGTNQQEVVATIIADYQSRDTEFMQRFPQYKAESADTKEVEHDA